MTPKRMIIPVFVPHLGCPHMCVFCNQRHISGQTEAVTADTVRRTVDEALVKLPMNSEKCIAFYGGSFTAIPGEEQESLLGAAKTYIDNGTISYIRLSTRPDSIDDEIIQRLKRFGVKTVELGVQSMCDDVLVLSGRGHNADDARKAAHMLKNAGFELILQMMTGLPGDTPEKSIFTATEFVKLKPDGIRIYPTVVIKDTKLYDMWLNGEYREHTVENAVDLCSDILDIFETAKIPVVRLGLNPTDELSGGEAAAGAYHPALRELAEGKRYLKKELSLISQRDTGLEITFGIPYGKLSQAIGHKRANAEYIKKHTGVRCVRFRECDIPENTVVRIDR